MKKVCLSFLLIPLLSVLAAFVTYKIVGPPGRSVACDPGNLPEHYVCLSTVEDWPGDDVLWVDARPRIDWKRDGVKGSILINDQEDWLDLEPDFMFSMIESPKPKVVVYCNQSGCGSSKYVANQLRERHAETFGFQVFVLEGGVKALRKEK